MKTWHRSPLRAHEVLVDAAARAEAHDPARAAAMFALATLPAGIAGACGAALRAAQRADRLAQPIGGPAAVLAGLAHGQALALCGEAATGYPLQLRWEPRLGDLDPATALQLTVQSALFHIWVEEYERARIVLDRVIDDARSGGTSGILPYGLAVRFELWFRTGRWTAARADAAESEELARAMAQVGERGFSLSCLARLEAARGLEADCRLHVAQSAALIEPSGAGSLVTFNGVAMGLLELGAGHAEAAIGHLHEVARINADDGPAEPAVAQWAPDLIEAYVQVGRPDEARDALALFETQARHTGRTWALAAAARCRGLLAGHPDDAGRWFTEALSWHDRTPTPFERARTQLCWGRRLRRDKRRNDARSPLRAALATFDRLGAAPWSARPNRSSPQPAAAR